MNDTPSGLTIIIQEAIEVRLWEIYLIRNRNNLLARLTAYAIDKGPLNRSSREYGQIAFRFTKFDWDRTICRLLSSQSVPYDIAGVYSVNTRKDIVKRKVYIAEDDLNILFALNTVLENAGYDVTLSHCGSPMMEKDPPVADVFIFDYMMPDINGLDICRHLKAQPVTGHVPVIMISALREFGSQALKAGVDDFLEKPFDMKNLLKLVDKHTAYDKKLLYAGSVL